MENLTEKNRCSNIEKEKEVFDVSPSNSLLSKPRIAKLKALFERSPTNRDRNLSKHRGSQTVSRSHSLGAIRKPLFSEAMDTSQKNKANASVLPIPDGGKLKVPKLSLSATVISKPVPLIKRSKSLKTISQPQKLTTLTNKSSFNSDTVSDNQNKSGSVSKVSGKDSAVVKKPETMSKATFKKSVTSQDLQKEQFSNELYRRRRSLESLIGDEPPVITWPTSVMFAPIVNNVKTQNSKNPTEMTPSSSKHSFKSGQGVKEFAAESLKQQFQSLTIEAQKKMTVLVSGIGIRERRNSFRQAISKDDGQIGKQNRAYEYIWIDPKKSKQRLESKTIQVRPHSKNFKDNLTVRNQNGEILHPVVTCDQPDGIRKEETIQNYTHNKPETSKADSSPSKPAPIQRAKTQVLNSDLHHPRFAQRPHVLVRTLSSHAIQDKNSTFSVVRPNDDSRRIVESKNLFLHRLNVEIQEGKNLRRPETNDIRGNNPKLELVKREQSGNTETISITSGTKFGEKGTVLDTHTGPKRKEISSVRLNAEDHRDSDGVWNYGRPHAASAEKSSKNSGSINSTNADFYGVHSLEHQKSFRDSQPNDNRRINRTANSAPKRLELRGTSNDNSNRRLTEGHANESHSDLDRKIHRTWLSPGSNAQSESGEIKLSNPHHTDYYPKGYDHRPMCSPPINYPKKVAVQQSNRKSQIIEVRKKNIFSGTNSVSSHSSGEMNHSDQHSQKSDSPRVVDTRDIEGIAKPEIIRIKPGHLKPDKKSCVDDSNRHEHGSESSSSSSARELASVLPPKPPEEVYNYGEIYFMS